MASQFDASEFVDDDFQTAQAAQKAGAKVLNADSKRAPSRDEVESKVGQMHDKLAELKRVQQELERERAVLEETRRRQAELTTGREEMLQQQSWAQLCKLGLALTWPVALTAIGIVLVLLLRTR